MDIYHDSQPLPAECFSHTVVSHTNVCDISTLPSFNQSVTEVVGGEVLNDIGRVLMFVYRTDTKVKAKTGERLEEDGWKTFSPFDIESPRSLILAGITETEHDQILNVISDVDPDGLRGFMVKLHIDKPEEGDPAMINLVAIPARDQILRHQDRFYLVRGVVQSSNFGVAAYVKKVSRSEFEALVT